jgi:diacylglycerol kinase family enzyme
VLEEGWWWPVERHVVLVLNGRSGGGRHQPAIRRAAVRHGWEVREVGPGADPVRLAESAAADVLVAAGGDGTVGAVAGVAIERDLPLAVLPCGTRNHFAADAGLDIDRPESALETFENWEETRVDVGSINGRVFLNTVSIGFYSSMVRDPQYRTRRLGVTVSYLRRAVLGRGDDLAVTMTTAPRVTLPARVLTVLVSNNAYSPGFAPSAALRPRLDEGMLWIHVLGVDAHRGTVLSSLLRAAGSLLVGRGQVAAWPARTQVLRLDRDRVTVGIDGEAIELAAPLELRSNPGALRLLRPPLGDARDVTLRMQT